MCESTSKSTIKFINCRLLRNHEIITDDLWVSLPETGSEFYDIMPSTHTIQVRDGVILDPQKTFYDENCNPERVIDCGGNLIVPGFIECQINGAFGVDFSYDVDTSAGLAKVAKELLKHGVTSFCPTLVTSPSHIYHKVLPMINKTAGGVTGAGILGVHLEGPFISKEKKGAHPEQCILPLDGADQAMEEVYGEGFEEHTAIITLAPELPGALDEIQRLTEKGVVCSIGHSEATLKDGERAVRAGAKFITHLFNAMLPFHHRDPGLVGLLTSWKLPKNCHVFYGLIADGIHTHPATMRIAHRTNPSGLVLVSDAIGAAGLAAGVHNLGQQSIEVRDKKAFVTGTNTLCGRCVRTFYEATECTLVEALEAATLHPAQLLGITERKGTLAFGSDADLLVLDDGLTVLKTFIAGECVWNRSHDQ